MNIGPALSMLLLTAQTAGVDVDKTAAAPGISPPPIEELQAPKPVLRLGLKEIVENQSRAQWWGDAGRGRVGFSLAVGPEELWGEFREKGAARAWSLSELTRGVNARLYLETYSFLYQGGLVRVIPAFGRQTPQASFSVSEMLRYLHTAAIQVLFSPVRYAVLYEDGRLAPASVSLLRQDSVGQLWVTYKKVEDLDRIHWFVSINGTLFGMRLEGSELVFYSKPTPVKGFYSDERLLL